MGIIVSARSLMAVMQPLTGTRATGTVTVTSVAASATLARNSYAIPVIENQRRPELLMKVGEGPNTDGSWTVTSSGTSVTMISNIGGKRQCLLAGTTLQFDPVLPTIASAVTAAQFEGGTDLTTFGALRDAAMVEYMGPDRQLDLSRSGLVGFPGALIAWVDSQPVDGTSSAATPRESRLGTRKSLWQENFQIAIFANKSEEDHARRAEGLEVLDQLTDLLVDRQSIDGYAFSNPSGIRIGRRWREIGNQAVYQRFYVYGLLVSITGSFTRASDRSYNIWETSVIDATKQDDGETDLTIVDDVTVDMT